MKSNYPLIVMAYAEDARQVLRVSKSGKVTAEGSYPTGPGLEAAWRTQLSALRPDGRCELGVRLPLSWCLERRFVVPRSALPELDRIAGIELDRKTPFTRENAYSDYVVDEASCTKQKVAVRQFVVRKEKLDDLISEVRSAGHEPVFADVYASDPAVPVAMNFLNAHVEHRDAISFAATYRVLAVFIATLLVSAAYLTLDQQNDAIASLERKIAVARQSALGVRRDLGKTQSVASGFAAVRDFKARSAALTGIWADLTRRLPDTAWITSLRFDGRQVRITGFAVSAAALIHELEQSPLFVSAAFAAQTTVDAATSRERFSIIMKMDRVNAGQQDLTGQ